MTEEDKEDDGDDTDDYGRKKAQRMDKRKRSKKRRLAWTLRKPQRGKNYATRSKVSMVVEKRQIALRPIHKEKLGSQGMLTKRKAQRKGKRLSFSQKTAPDKFICEKCGEEFQSGWALGGHASRVHPGQSDAYRRKIQRREERGFERLLLAAAKRRHMQVYGPHTPINRVKIRKFKRELRGSLLEEYLEASKD